MSARLFMVLSIVHDEFYFPVSENTNTLSLE